MEFFEYQRDAQSFDLYPKSDLRGRVMPLLGLQRKVGELASTCREHLEGEITPAIQGSVSDQVGDVLWYLTNVAIKFGCNLDHAALNNLAKVGARWHSDAVVQKTLFDDLHYLDQDFPQNEQFPRQFRIQFEEIPVQGSINGRKLKTSYKTLQIGDLLTDNAAEDDGYRFHDVLHLAYVAVLGWSPVIRALLKCKRKSNSKIDEVEDGARARDREEAITAFVFQYARRRHFFKGAKRVDNKLIDTVRTIVSDLEVAVRTPHHWEQAILNGYAVFRKVYQNGGGYVSVDMEKHRLIYRPLENPRIAIRPTSNEA
jgi:hypothetical protein